MTEVDETQLMIHWLTAAGPVLDALERAVVVASPAGTVLFVNRAAEELYGWPASEVVGRNGLDLLVPDESRRRLAAVRATVLAGEPFRGDLRLQRRDGRLVQVQLSLRPLRVDGLDGPVAALVGSAEDVTRQRLLERQVGELGDRLLIALEAGGLGTFQWSPATGEVRWDATMERLCGLEPGAFGGTVQAWRALVHPDDAVRVHAELDRAVARRGAFVIEHRVRAADGSVRWLEIRGRVVVDEHGSPAGAIGCASDLTERKQAELARERAAAEARAAADRDRVHHERVQFLADINQALAESVDQVDLMRRVTAAAVPRLGDWCSIHVLPRSETGPPEVQVAHTDPAMVAYAAELQERFPYDPDAATGVPQVLRTGRTEFYPELPGPWADDPVGNDEVRAVLRELDLRSALIVPVAGNGRVLGALQFVSARDNRRYTASDVALAETVGGRIGAALATMRLLDEQREIAWTLQASLLPRQLPVVPGVDVAVRYWAAGEATEVGGDFYDLFSLGDDRWALVIGDVCGTGAGAAALTGLARHTIRAAATHGRSPAEVLQWLNDAVRRDTDERFCTAAYAMMQPSAGGIDLDLVIGGHPRPLVVRSDGEVRTVGRPGTLLGVFPTVDTPVAHESVAAGELVVLYTDGVTDVAPPYGLTADELEKVVARAGSGAHSAEELADRLGGELSAILPVRERADDLALLVLHVR